MAAVAITIAALTAGSVAVASADQGPSKGDIRATVLSSLVTAGTITQAQSDAIAKKFEEVMAAHKANHEAYKSAREAYRSGQEALIVSTIGLPAATIKARLVAGESLATIAGAKKDALIAALVAYEIKAIDAAVVAGKLTAAEATILKAKLPAQVTAAVNVVGPRSLVAKGLGKYGWDSKDSKGNRP